MKIKGQRSKIKSQNLKPPSVGFTFAFCFLIFAFALPAPAATKIFLHDASSPIQQSPDYVFRQADSTQGSAKVTAVTNSLTGALSGHKWPYGYIITKTGNGTKTIWLTPPLSSGVTVSGTITPNLWGLESAVQCNCGARYEVYRWSVLAGGLVSSLGISTDDGVSEWGTAAAVRTAPTLTPASTAFSAGDRIAIIIYNDDGNSVTEANGRNWTLDYGAASGVDGDSYLSFTETISFSSDSNNARPIPMLSLLRPAAEWWKEYFEKLFDWNDTV